MNTALHFLRKGWEVDILDNFSRRGVEINAAELSGAYGDRVNIFRGDIRDGGDLLSKLAERCDVLTHLAAQVAVTASVADPRGDFGTNALGTFNVLEAARLSRRRPIILFASTNKVYGALGELPIVEGETRYAFGDGRSGIAEGQPLDFHSPYGCSKGAADQYVRDYARIYDLRTVVFRQSCVYGPRQLGLEDQGWVAWFMIAGMLGRPVQIYGNGKQVRDLLYVEDLVRCYALAIERIGDASGRIYNIGGGSGYALSLLEFLDFLRREHGIAPERTFAETRAGDQPIFVSDNAKALKDLGWRPTTGVREGVKSLARWLTEHRDVLETVYGGTAADAAPKQPLTACV